MSEKKHTPGPWTSHGNGIHKGTGCIATTNGDNRYNNARLIGLAPEMFRILDAMVNTSQTPETWEALLVEAEQVIKKARGEQ